jgi:plasmid stabilization system protein ParE
MAKRKIIWSIRSRNDLLQIFDFFYQRNGTKTYSTKLNATIRRAVNLLGKNPEIGITTEIIGVKNLIKENFSIFYKITNDSIVIITVWHNSQNPERLKFHS